MQHIFVHVNISRSTDQITGFISETQKNDPRKHFYCRVPAKKKDRFMFFLNSSKKFMRCPPNQSLLDCSAISAAAVIAVIQGSFELKLGRA